MVYEEVVLFLAPEHFDCVRVTVGQKGNELVKAVDSCIGRLVYDLLEALSRHEFSVGIEGASSDVEVTGRGFSAVSVGSTHGQQDDVVSEMLVGAEKVVGWATECGIDFWDGH